MAYFNKIEIGYIGLGQSLKFSLSRKIRSKIDESNEPIRDFNRNLPNLIRFDLKSKFRLGRGNSKSFAVLFRAENGESLGLWTP